MKTQKREKMFEMKRLNKARHMSKPGAKSDYARKRQFLINNGGWGTDYPDKPLKRRS